MRNRNELTPFCLRLKTEARWTFIFTNIGYYTRTMARAWHFPPSSQLWGIRLNAARITNLTTKHAIKRKCFYSFLRHFHDSKKSVYLSKVPQNTIKEHANKMIKSGNLIPCKLDLYVTLCTWHSIQFWLILKCLWEDQTTCFHSSCEKYHLVGIRKLSTSFKNSWKEVEPKQLETLFSVR